MVNGKVINCLGKKETEDKIFGTWTIDKLEFIKIKNICFMKDPTNRKERQGTN